MSSILLLLLGTTPSWSAPFTVDDLIADINARQLTTLEQVVSSLPYDLRSYYTLQHQGGGLQGASYENPRAILYGKDAKFVVTYTGSDAQDRGNQLEILQFNDQRKEFELYALSFPVTLPLTKPAKNPAECMTCHSTAQTGAPFPIWGRYPFWQGTYGQNDDRLVGEEKPRFDAFVRTWGSNPRYSGLVRTRRGSDSPVSPYSDQEHQNFTFRPNSNLGSLLVRLTARQIAERMKRVPDYEKYLLLASPSFFHCKSELAADERSLLNRRVGAAFRTPTAPVATAPFWETENVTYLLGSDAFTWGLLPANRPHITDPYFLDGFFLTMPNHVLAHVKGAFFSKYPELEDHYKHETLRDYVGQDAGRLAKSPQDWELIDAIDALGSPLNLKKKDCKPLLRAVRKEFLQ